MKTCFKCNQTKPLSEFYRHKGMKDGHLGKCKKCATADVRRHRIVSERPREYDRERYRENPARREAAARRGKKLYRAHPEKTRARTALGNALRDGKIQRPDKCEICQTETRLHGHHEDYSEPLNVEWLCPKCHHGRHANENL